MAHRTLAQHSPLDFPQLLSRSTDPLFALVARAEAKQQLGECWFETAETQRGACDSVPCRKLATVHHVESEMEYCLAHFNEVSRG